MRIIRTVLWMCLGMVVSARAELELPAIFGDHMILQQKVSLPVWGWAEPGATVTVSFGSQSKGTVTDKTGKWMVRLDPLPANANPAELVVNAISPGGARVTRKLVDVIVGDVWLCSGQSNMEFVLEHSHNAATEIPRADYKTIRLFTVPHQAALEPRTNLLKSSWVVCTPQTAKRFSAVGYFFGRELHERLKQPIGLINSSWQATGAQSWTSLGTLSKVPEIREYADQFTSHLENIRRNGPAMKEKYEKECAVWLEKFKPWSEEWRKVQNASPAEREAVRRRGVARPPDPFCTQYMPTTIFNGMVAPLIPFGIKGVIWYQGEANLARYIQYRALFPALINDWRQAWGRDEFPFLFVQLAGYGRRSPKPPSKSDWAGLREAQTRALELPKTGMAVAIDAGDVKFSYEVHPKNKFVIGQRLARVALHTVYGQDIECSGPMYDSMVVDGGRVKLSFKHVGGGLGIGSWPPAEAGAEPAKPSAELKGFAMAGADKKFVWAKASIEGDHVILQSDEVSNPVAVRYGWDDYPDVNLYNKEQLPAVPFRTDQE